MFAGLVRERLFADDNRPTTYDPAPNFPCIFRIFQPPMRSLAAGDAAYSLLDYVQISLIVTKVLIRKSFHRLLYI